MKMALITIDSQEKSDEITDLLKKTFEKVNSAWIGAVATGNDHEYAWISNGEKLNFTNWSNGEPTKSDVYNEYCMLTGWPRKLQWDDNDCHSRHGFICEYHQNYSEFQKNENSINEKRTQENFAALKEMRDELERNRLFLKLLMDYKISRDHSEIENKISARDIYINFRN